MLSRLRQRAFGAVLVVLMLTGASSIAAAPAYAASGKVTCSTSAVVGMWVNVSGGTSGWATLTSTSYPNVKYWSYDTQGKTWNANIGCGGTPSNWGQSLHLDWTNQTSGDIICSDTGYIRKCTIG